MEMSHLGIDGRVNQAFQIQTTPTLAKYFANRDQSLESFN